MSSGGRHTEHKVFCRSVTGSQVFDSFVSPRQLRSTGPSVGTLVPPAGFPCSAHARVQSLEEISQTRPRQAQCDRGTAVKNRLNTSAVLIYSQVCNTPLREKQNACVGSNGQSCWFSPGYQACSGVWSDWQQEGVFWRRSNTQVPIIPDKPISSSIFQKQTQQMRPENKGQGQTFLQMFCRSSAGVLWMF